MRIAGWLRGRRIVAGPATGHRECEDDCEPNRNRPPVRHPPMVPHRKGLAQLPGSGALLVRSSRTRRTQLSRSARHAGIDEEAKPGARTSASK